MSNIGALSVSIEGDNTSLNRALTDSQSRMDRFGSMAARVALSVAKIGAAAAGAAAALGIATVRNVANAADEMAKLSQRTGVAVEDLGRLSHAANLSGVSQGELTTSLTRLSRAMQDASNGTGTATQAFSRLGVSVTDAEGNLRSQADVMSDVADRFARMEDGATKTALAQEIFGRSGANLIPMLNQGSQGLRQMGDEAERLGLVFDEKTAKAAEQFNDNLTRLRGVAQGAAREFAGPVIGSLLRFTNGLVEARSRSRELSSELARVRGIEEQRSAFFRLGEAIAGVIGRMTGLLNLSDAERLAQVTEELVKQEATLARLEAGDSRSNAMRQRNLRNAREEIEASRVEIALINERIAAREREAQLMLEPPEPFDLYIPGLPKPEEVNERLEQINQIVAVNHEASLQRLREFGMSESEIEMERHRQRLDALAAALFDEAVTHEEQYALTEKLEEEHMRRMEQIRVNGLTRIQRFSEASFKEQARTMIGELQSMTQATAGESQAMFEINKAASLANAVVKGYESIQNAYAFGSKFAGPAGGAAMAAIAAVATAAQVRGIASQSFRGASAGSLSGAGAGAASASSVSMAAINREQGMATTTGSPSAMDRPRTPATATINIVGESFTRSQVAQLIDAINDLTADGARLVIA
jgi:hypothetical protein